MTSPTYIAFFDVDETLINCKTMFSFLKFFYIKKTKNVLMGNFKFLTYKFKTQLYSYIGKDRYFLNRYYYSRYEGSNLAFLMSISEEWFANLIQKVTFNDKVVGELKQHQKNGAGIVLVSGSFIPCLLPIAKKLDVTHILGVNLEEQNGKLTGCIIPPQTIGSGKADAIIEFISRYPEISLNKCYAYGDHDSDLRMLSLVGNPIVVGNNAILLKSAKNNNWKIMN